MACPFSQAGSTSHQSTTALPVWADPLGPSSLNPSGTARYSASGAPQIRSQLFNYMQGISPQMQTSASNLASGLTSAAASPFYGQAQKAATDTLAGKYLGGSPELDRAMAANTSGAMASAADADARLRSQFGKSGMGFSTGAQEASEANRAATMADAARTNAATYLQNYEAERQAQQAAPGAFQAAQAAPLNYLSQVPGALMAPVSAEGQPLTALSSGGQVITPTVNESITPSQLSSLMGTYGAISGSL